MMAGIIIPWRDERSYSPFSPSNAREQALRAEEERARQEYLEAKRRGQERMHRQLYEQAIAQQRAEAQERNREATMHELLTHLTHEVTHEARYFLQPETD